MVSKKLLVISAIVVTVVILVVIGIFLVKSFTPAMPGSSANTEKPIITPGNGASLYAAYCSTCHGPLARSTKLGTTASQIHTAIADVDAMKSLSSLSTTQIESISQALGASVAPADSTGATGSTNATGSSGSNGSTSSPSSTGSSGSTTAVSNETTGTPVAVPVLPQSIQVYSNGQYVVLAWNDLGMHCYNPSFEDIGVLPPYNNLWAQVIRVEGEEPQIVTSGVTVTYLIVNNTFSAGKTDFWDYAGQLFGVALQPNIGLTGKGLTGTMAATVSATSTSGRLDHFQADGIPLTEYRDQDVVSGSQATWQRYPYQLAVISVTNSASGALLARTVVTAPVSTEMRCDTCHGDAGAATAKYPITPTGKVDKNILTLHDYLHPQNPSLSNSVPILCAECHSSNALGAAGKPGVPNLSNAMHSNHAKVGIASTTQGCYACHPGPQTQCLRDIMSQKGMQCVDCHGTLATVGINPSPWFNEPRCDNPSCHPTTVTLNNPLFRHSTAMHGIYCEACHGSTHAVLPSTQPNDAIQSMALQQISGPLQNCSVCHGVAVRSGGNPHITEDAIPPNALWFIALPFLATIPATVYVAYRKKLWKRLDLSFVK